jgi:hypothetical protein
MPTVTCSPSHPCYNDGCAECDALPCHYPCTVDGPHYQPSCEIGPGFTYWRILAPSSRVGVLGDCRTPSEARAIAAAYNDPTATRRSVRLARMAAR